MTELTVKQPPSSNPDDVVLSGYLFKKTRDGKWQRRWFETNGVYLTYYKSRKMEKLLAALSLPQVGEIKMIPFDQDSESKEGLFALELNTRVYTLRAKNKEEAELWVQTLCSLREKGLNRLTLDPTRPSVQVHANKDGKLNLLSDPESAVPTANWIKSNKKCFGIC